MADDFAQAARALKAAGNGGFRREVEAKLKKAEEETAARMRDAIPESLPRGGGLAALVAEDASFDVHAGSTTSGVVVATEVSSRYNIARMNDSGSFSHQVYGQDVYVDQSEGVHQGFLDEPFRKGEAGRKKAAEDAVKATATTIDRSIQ